VTTTPEDSGRDWHVRDIADHGEASALALSQALDIHIITARVLVGRGVLEPARARRFMEPRLADLRRPDGPGGIAGFDLAVERIIAAVVAGTMIGVFGDYDVDGITTCAIVTETLRAAGTQVVPRVANRHAGYGFGVADSSALMDAGCGLIITCDTGTGDLPAIATARARGIDVIVLDHHQVPDGSDHPAFALVNPHRPDSPYPFKGLCSAGLGFMLAAALRTRLKAMGRELSFDIRDLLDLVAVGTIADMAPLIDENRTLVTKGLEMLAKRRRPGLAALLERAEVPRDRPLGEIDVSFRIAPRLNAPGRLGDATPSLLLLLSRGAEAAALAEQLEVANTTRRELTEQVTAQALEDAALQADRAGIVVGRAGWHHGVVGIVAARIVERYARPVCVVGIDETGLGRGSIRAGGPVDVGAALRVCTGLLLRHGGHAAAAGCTVRVENLEAFGLAFAEAVARAGAHAGGAGPLELDAAIGLDAMDVRLARELGQLAPFGPGNAPPMVGLYGTLVRESRRVGDGSHLKLILGSSGSEITRSAIGFRLGERDPGPGARIDVAVQPEISTFRGAERIELKVHDLRRI
jgi:single-stranded-DNA-specific exonuclease